MNATPVFTWMLLSIAPLYCQNSPDAKVWDDTQLADWPAPVAGLNARPGFFRAEQYYAVPGDNYRTYPVYHPDREPRGYWQKLNRLRPEKLVEPSQLHTLRDWIAAGKRVWDELDATSFRTSDPKLIAQVRSPEGLSRAELQPDGTVFQLRWVVTPAGVQLSYLECASCHTRFMPDGSRVPGAPTNVDLSAGGIGSELADRDLLQYFAGDSIVAANYKTFAVPWLEPDVHASIRSMTLDQLGT